MGLDNQNIKGADEMIRKLQAMKSYINEDVPEIIGTEAVNHFKNNFQEEGFDGDKWESRRSQRQGSTGGQKVLTYSGELSESIDYRIQGTTIIIFTDKPYGEIHNEGGKITVTPKMKGYFFAKSKEAKENGEIELANQYKAFALSKEIIIKQRKFMGQSPVLIGKITDRIKRDLTQIANS